MSYCRYGSDGGRCDLYCIATADDSKAVWITSLPYYKQYNGESYFKDYSLDQFLERVNCLKEAGYHVPWYTIERIERELEEN